MNKRAFAEAVEQHCWTKNVGENGMPQYSDSGVGSDALVLHQLVRGGKVQAQVEAILARNDPYEIADLCVLLFVTRNTRGGKGEKKLAYDMMILIWQRFPKTAAQLLPLLVHYGYWKDMFLLLVEGQNKLKASQLSSLRETIIKIVAEQLRKDLVVLENFKASTKPTGQPSISLLAKWLPREGKSLDKKTKFVKDFVQEMWPEESSSTMDQLRETWESNAKARYRRAVAELTSYLELPEVLLAAQREDEINFGRMASKATFRLRNVLINQNAFGNPRSENPKRIRLAERFLEHVVSKGLKGQQLMPHEIVRNILTGNVTKEVELVLDAQWKNLWKGVKDQIKNANGEYKGLNPTRMVPMADVSGSMGGIPMEVSIALSIGLSEITHPAFQNMVLTFSDRPQFHKLCSEGTIVQKVKDLSRADWQMSTNFEAAYDLILDIVRKNKLDREDMPVLIVFSDMQFNEASRTCKLDVMHDEIKRKVAAVAEELGWADSEPTPIVYWNLRNTGGHPVDKNTEGAVLLSGFSPSMLRVVMSGDALEETEVEIVQMDGTVQKEKVRVTPEQILRKTLDDKMYDAVRVVLATSEEGCFQGYKLQEPVQVEGGFDLL